MKKTREDLQKHLQRVADCGKSIITIRQRIKDDWFLIPVKTRCQSRFCETCAKARRGMLLEKMRYFKDQKHCTKFEITFPATAPDPYQDPDFYSKTWDKIAKRLRRYAPKMKYFRFVELTKRGIPHFHVLCNAYIPHQLLSMHAEEAGAGKICWIKAVDPQHTFQYITKYISKATGADLEHATFFFLSGMRQVSYSRKIFVFCPRNDTFYVMNFDPEPGVPDLLSYMDLKYAGFVDFVEQPDANAPPIFYQRPHRDIESQMKDVSIPGLTRAKMFKNRFDLNSKEAKSDYVIFA